MNRAARLTGVVLLAVAVAGSAVAHGGEKLTITSDKLEVRHDEHRALFEGQVVAAYGEVRLECAALDVRYDGAGQVVQLEATGAVRVRSKDVTARARRAVLRRDEGVLVLDGEPEVERGSHRLSGARITLHLESGKVEVERAVGSFELSLGAGSGP